MSSHTTHVLLIRLLVQAGGLCIALLCFLVLVDPRVPPLLLLLLLLLLFLDEATNGRLPVLPVCPLGLGIRAYGLGSRV
jgi:hypothetical protein